MIASDLPFNIDSFETPTTRSRSVGERQDPSAHKVEAHRVSHRLERLKPLTDRQTSRIGEKARERICDPGPERVLAQQVAFSDNVNSTVASVS